MILHEYDTSHFGVYDYIINFYKDSNIEDVIKDIYKNNDFDPKLKCLPYNINKNKELDELISDITITLFKLKQALDILEDKYITNIGARVFHTPIKEDYNPSVQKSYLIQAWRS